MSIIKKTDNEIFKYINGQEIIIKDPIAYFNKFINKDIVDEFMTYELQSWKNSITNEQTKQGLSIANNMTGKTFTVQNYFYKVMSDYFLNKEEFNNFYKPHPYRPLVNMIAGYKLCVKNETGDITNKEEFKTWDFTRADTLLDFYVWGAKKLFERKNNKLKTIHINFNFDKKYYAPYVLSLYAKSDYPNMNLTLTPQNVDDYLKILHNPATAPLELGNEVYYISDENDPNAELTDRELTGLKRIEL